MSLLIYGGCYDTAKRNEVTNVTFPPIILNSIIDGTPRKIRSEPLQFDPHGPLPKNYKRHYGIRYSGVTYDLKPMFYGFDLFYQISGDGLDLEQFLTFCFVNGLEVDWYNFQRTSRERSGWPYDALIRKVSYPVQEVFGKEYWLGLEQRFKYYEYQCMMQEQKDW